MAAKVYRAVPKIQALETWFVAFVCVFMASLANADCLKGDLNRDGVVNFQDFLIFSSEFGKQGVPCRDTVRVQTTIVRTIVVHDTVYLAPTPPPVQEKQSPVDGGMKDLTLSVWKNPTSMRLSIVFLDAYGDALWEEVYYDETADKIWRHPDAIVVTIKETEVEQDVPAGSQAGQILYTTDNPRFGRTHPFQGGYRYERQEGLSITLPRPEIRDIYRTGPLALYRPCETHIQQQGGWTGYL